ncbi:MAG: ATP-binding protein [Planctomycetota bacterium]|nr:ATP-binding protein [Planctomycetota bacterium]
MNRDGNTDWRRTALRYVLTVAIVAAAAVARWWLEVQFGNLYAAFITFYPAVLLVAITLGAGPGIVATLLSAATVDFFFMPPYGCFAVAGAGEMISLVIFTGTNTGLCWVTQRMRRLSRMETFAAAKAREARELADLNERIARQNEELQRSNRDLEQFAYVASHDLQEPLRMVTSFGGILRDRYDQALDAKGKEYLGFIVEAGQRMHSLVRGLLDYSRIRGRRRNEAVNLGACVAEALANLRTSIDEAGATLEVGEMPALEVDPGQITQLFQNLLANAVKFRADRPPRVEISARPEGATWIVRVADNGIGIDPRYAERIFQIFQRLHTHEAFSGTGIGLAICRKIIEGHGGRIWVESAPGQGAAFCFTLNASGGPKEPA